MSDRPERAQGTDPTGCFLLVGSLLVCGTLGLMTLGSYYPELSRTGFAVSLVALLGAGLLSAILSGIADFRIRMEDPRWKLRGEHLDALGKSLGVERMYAEPDHRYRRRIGRAMRQR